MADSSLSRPYETGWSSSVRPAAQAIWRWHDALAALDPVTDDALDAVYERVKAGEPLRILPDAVWEAAYEACANHSLKRRYLAVQVRGLKGRQPPVRYETAEALERFLNLWIVPHGRLLAGLIPGAASLKRATDHLSRGFFYTGMVAHLPQHLEAGDLYIPQDDLEQAGVSVQALRKGRVREPVRKLLWKQIIRARNELAQGHKALGRLSWRASWRLKFWWLGALEILNEVERRDFDVWSKPLTLDRWRTTQLYLQTYFGRATARMS